ncbi:MAG: 23S rRNA (adenine(2503)-C(2))-methyltransferase RlmN [Chloroflexi bacterium]|nr:23S rRNA (adenine(2503)-C(2))-methyltransferase RlmN [Chloroflexota bacterium]MBS60274.1 23S rRNA (adenine(2503)-C(2))-methyltransferase RlmN [Anaerolineaceae bacterium]HCU79980.1 23S rRNA (adenine(2503)-C(2))-methyltransferase RlmN [Chloroflexota bacterium]|tara:strand:- start:3173 stop:4225 length:1053 start_codon:yes stop_codon:yes gene_type:complete
MDTTINLLDLNVNMLQEKLEALGEPKYRAQQLWHAIYQKHIGALEEATTLPISLRTILHDKFRLGNLTEINELASKDKHTTKVLFGLPDGHKIETVLMRYNKRRTVCISTQAGCALGCVFCATGQMGLDRHLTVGEIVEQVLWASRKLSATGNKLTNIVLMGMGEPFHNYTNSIAAINRLEDSTGMAIGARRVTVSTAGHAKAIKQFAKERRRERLAVSLHAATDNLRDQLMPINRRFPLDELMAACRMYSSITNRRISFEWALIDDVNDSEEHARDLCKLIGNIDCHVNVIPLNPTDQFHGNRSNEDATMRFKTQLDESGIPCTIRVRRGLDISAGCGQLKSENTVGIS